MYQKVDTNLNFVDREKAVEKFWEDNNIFKKSMEHRKEGETYTFYDGPPTANGKPHIGHVLTRVIKDMIPRYRTMKGYMVPRKAGWDTHGLPVELEVEKKLGLDGKEQIEEYGMEPFIQQCKESVWKYKGMWEDFSSTVGFWADMENPYVTYHDDYIESEWWALKEIWNKKLLYKGFKIVPYCPRCGTPLSAQEVSQGYKTVKERSAIVRFKVVGEDAYFLAWTTTPWTLPSNVALCVNPTEVYCKVKAADGYTYYMAEALLDKVLGKLGSEETPAYEVLEKYVGKDLEYKEYEPLFACAGEAAAKQKKKAHFVTADNYNKHYSAYGLITKVLKSIPQQIDTVYFAIADQFLVLRLKEENTAWIPNYEIREVENGKRPIWNIEAIGMGQSNLVKPSGNIIWRNLIKYGKNKFVVCVDRMIIKGKFVGIVYIINSSRKGYPRGMNWDVTKFVNIQSLGQVLEHDKKISEKILETNK